MSDLEQEQVIIMNGGSSSAADRNEMGVVPMELEETLAAAGLGSPISRQKHPPPPPPLASPPSSSALVIPSTSESSPPSIPSQKGIIPKPKATPSANVVGRAKQSKLLKAVLGNVPGQALPGAIFLWGPPSAGKSYTLERVLEGTNVHQVKVHSAEILCGRRAFYETIVKQLVSCNGTSLGQNFKCDSLHSLFSNFSLFFERMEDEEKAIHVAVIIEGAESLRGENEDILQFLVSLQDITQGPFCVVFISTLPPGRFMPQIMDHAIIPLYFPQYTMDELTQIICDRRMANSNNSSRSAGCHDFYVKMIVSMFYYVCRDLRKLLRLATSHWEAFRQMVENEKDVNLTRLWKKLEPQLKSQFFEMNSTLAIKPGNDQENPGKTMDMPANCKYLLIAAYLATHNPASSDKRFFVKSRVGRTKKSRSALKTDIANTFARSFELNRLNAIFGSIQEYCNDKAVNKNRNISFMNALTTMCQNKLIQHLGEDSTGNQKYKCLLDYDTVLNISRSVSFELNNYLFRLT